MKSGALLPSNLPRVIDRSNLCDRSMTQGKLLGNNAALFIFISILIMTQLISFLHFLLTAVRTGRLGVLPIKIYRGNNAVFLSVDLIGEKNQVILEYRLECSEFNSQRFCGNGDYPLFHVKKLDQR